MVRGFDLFGGDISPIAGADFIKSSNRSWLDTTNTYRKIKEIKVNLTGRYRIYFNLKQDSSGNAYGRIYKNGTPYGTERVTDSSFFQTFTEDLEFSAGDLVQLYIRRTGGIVANDHFSVRYNQTDYLNKLAEITYEI